MPSTRKQLATYRKKRDFRKTAEPAGRDKRPARKSRRKRALVFVIQKHDASQLHFDLRLELDGVMKSWAVPKGPSTDPSVKRLAMQVEDHPMEYNNFEGTIAEGEYGGGTVMIWDRGTYTADHADEYGGDNQAAVRAGLERGDLKFTLEGERLTGSFVLVRTRYRGSKASWLLIKHRGAGARRGSNVVGRFDTSAVSGRTMDEIAQGDSPQWSSNRKSVRKSRKKTSGKGAAKTTKRVVGARTKHSPKANVSPMLASVARELPEGDEWTYEPKYDGVRVLAFVTPTAVRLITRNAKDKTAQFPEIAAALQKLPGKTGRSFVLDCEIVALVDGEPGRFQELQGRMHLENRSSIDRLSKTTPAALIVFDLLVDGEEPLLDEPWSKRRARLEKYLGRKRIPGLLLGETSADPAAMLQQAQAHGWEGLMAKRTTAPYRPGQRSRDWLKLKIEQRQELVVGGFTEPRRSREHLGALLLGYYDDGKLRYAGHTGGGFSRASLQQMYDLLAPLEVKTSPFSTTPRTNEKAHWVKPEIVVEVKFNEWTRDGKLRQPIFVGIRDDKDAHDVRREG
jgi:bifunctional non-homologous end joining protein LigD